MTGARPTEFATPSDLDAMRAVLDGRKRADVRAAAILAALAAGLRRGEVCALNVVDFREHDGVPVLHVETLKRRKRVKRLVPLKPDAAAVIAKYLRGEKRSVAEPLFTTAGTRYPFTRERLTARAVAVLVKSLLKRSGINRRLTAHSFRHGFATRLVETGADVRVVQELLGHASLSSTQRYLHTTFARTAEAVARI